VRKTIYIVHAKQAITKLVNIVFIVVNEHIACSKVADATSETLNDQGSCSEKNKSFVGNNKDLIKTTECQETPLAFFVCSANLVVHGEVVDFVT
jgi:hypothetical protein